MYTILIKTDIFMKKQFYLLTVLLIILVFIRCSSDATINSNASKAQTVVNSAILYADPNNQYSKLKSIEYTKMTKLYDEFGGLEDSTFQTHYYEFQPSITGSIKWNKGNKSHAIYYRDGTASKYEDSVHIPDSASTASAYSSMMASIYVMMMPWKLNDAGAKMEYVDRKVLPMVGPSDIISVNYNPANYESHTKSDLWWYYFDPATSKFLANKVDHGTGVFLITNESDQEVEGMKFHANRKSYKLDEEGNVERLRAWYEYGNINLQFVD